MRGIRKLAAVCCGFSAAVFIAHYLIPNTALYYTAALCAVIALLCLRKRNDNKWLRLCIMFFAAALGFSAYRYNYDTFIAPLSEFYDSEMTVSARVTDYPDEFDYGEKLNVIITDKRFRRVKAQVYDYNSCLPELKPGDEIKLKLELKSALERFNAETDSNISNDRYVLGYAEACEITGHWKYSTLYFPREIGHVLRQEIRVIFPQDASPFMLALLTGYKSEYYDDDALNAAMGLAGLSHVVAVSGMHVAFLIGFLQLISGKNRRTTIISLGLIWVFVIMVGASASAMRAGIMLSLLITAPLFKRNNDYITSLSFALALLLLLNPFAAGNIGLQLSFAAMAGIVIFGSRIFERFNERLDFRGVFGKILHYITGAFVSSIAVSVFTVPLIAIHFGYVSLLAPLANILCLWAVSLLFWGGYMLCAVGFVFPAASIVGANAFAWLVRYIVFVVKYIAKLPVAALYTENTMVLCWIVLCYVIFAACYFFRDKSFRPAFPICLASITLLAVVLAGRVSVLRDDGTVAALDVGSGECVAVTEKKHSVVIDCGSSGTMDNAGKLASSYIHGTGRHTVDYLVLTHVHRDHAAGVVWLLSVCDVKTLVLPACAGDYDTDGLLNDILNAALNNDTDIIYISEDTELKAGGISLHIYAPSEKGDKNERGITMTAEVNGFNTLIMGDVNDKVEMELISRHELSDTDLLMVGHHGSKYSTCQEFIKAAMPETAIISVGYNSHGHPTDAVLKRLDAYGVTIFRTDLQGRIIVGT